MRSETAATTEVPIDSVEDLVALVGHPTPATRDKARPALHDLDREWLAASPFCVLATSDERGNLDASPKGDPAGSLVHVLDDRTIVIAERPGNRRVDGYRNVLANPHVGLVFLIPGRGDTLRINGRARLVREADYFDELVVKGSRPILALVVEIDEIFHHCSKAFLRSRLWEYAEWAPTEAVPRRAVVAQALERPDESVETLDAHYGPSYAEKLY